jgi:transcriptional regulator with XRE-family HTH domain
MSKRKTSNYYTKLQGKLVEQDVDQETLAGLIGKSMAYVSLRMHNKAPWAQTDQYKILDEFNIPYEYMHEYFPKNGLAYQEEQFSQKDYEKAFLKLMSRALFEG